MFERFSDRARRVVVLAQEEARLLGHDYIGTEHLLLGLLHEGHGVAARALESLGVSLDAARPQVEEIIGRGQHPPSGHIPFTPQARTVLELSRHVSSALGQNHIGTEHILLGLTREGDGVAAQVLVQLHAERKRVRQRVIELIAVQQPKPVRRSPGRDALVTDVQARLDAIEGRLVSLEQRVGTGPDTADLDRRIAAARQERQDAADVEEYEQAASLRDQERELRASKAERQEQWAAGHPDLPALAEQCRELSGEIERLRGLLREHGIDQQDKPA